jgi:hypothetical protein
MPHHDSIVQRIGFFTVVVQLFGPNCVIVVVITVWPNNWTALKGAILQMLCCYNKYNNKAWPGVKILPRILVTRHQLYSVFSVRF